MRFVGVGAWQYWRWREQFLRANGLKALVLVGVGVGYGPLLSRGCWIPVRPD